MLLPQVLVAIVHGGPDRMSKRCDVELDGRQPRDHGLERNRVPEGVKPHFVQRILNGLSVARELVATMRIIWHLVQDIRPSGKTTIERGKVNVAWKFSNGFTNVHVKMRTARTAVVAVVAIWHHSTAFFA